MKDERAVDAGSRWVRVAKGLYLLGFGTFLLLCTQGILPWSIWGEAIRYWPVLLVAIGIRLLFERTRVAWLVLLGPVLVLGTVMYVTTGRAGARVSPADWEDLRVERPAGADRWTLEGRMTLTKLDLAARPLPRGVLIEGRNTPAGRASVRILEGGGACRVRVTNDRGVVTIAWSSAKRARRACDLRLAQTLPVALALDLALTEGTIDLAGAPVTGVGLDGAFNDLFLRLGAPAGGGDVSLDFEGSFNDIELRVPATTPVRVDTEGFVNIVDGRAGAAARAGPGYRLRLHGAFNRVVVEEG